ncbi:MAG: hypothetical protein ACREX9_07035 [Gammaproteobacteria bacterium]
MTTGNEAFSRVVIDAQLADQGWSTQDRNSVRYEYALPDKTQAPRFRRPPFSATMSIQMVRLATMNLTLRARSP